MVRITFLGTDATVVKDNHFCLIVQHKRCKILVDPSNSKVENVEYDAVIITDIDKDHYYKINLVSKDVPIYSTAGVIKYLHDDKRFKNRKLIAVEEATKICDRMKTLFFKTNKEVGHPSCGIKVEDVVIWSEIAPYVPKYNLKLLNNSHLICGVGNYEKPRGETDHKITFKEFIKVLETNEQGYKPRQIFITNLREDIKKHKTEVNKELRKWNGKVIDTNTILQYALDFKKRKKPKYRAITYDEIFGIKDFIPSSENKIVLDQKFDGKYVQILRRGDDIKFMVDPEELKEKKDYDITRRLKFQKKDLMKSKVKHFRLDAELVAWQVVNKKEDILHRTVANALSSLKTKIDDEVASKRLRLYVYDISEYKGSDIKNWPFKERIEALRSMGAGIDSKYVKFDIPITDLKKDNLSYIVDNSKDLKSVFDKIMNERIPSLPDHISEGVMIKRLNGLYIVPQNPNEMKVKKWKEIDLMIIGKIKVKGAERTWNYELGLEVPKDYWEKLPSKIQKRAGDYWLQYYGKTDNTNIDGDIGDILRVASEEVIKKKNEKHPKYPYYSGYINRAMELVPEKNRTDTLDVAERLSKLEPQRIPKTEIERWKSYEDLEKRTDWGWVQFHIRGITVEEYEDKEKELWEKFINHSLHADIRLDIKKAPKLMQFVVTESDWESYLRVFKGERDPATGNEQKGKVIIKPSAVTKTGVAEAVITRKAAKQLGELDIKNESYWIKPGEVGATPYTYSYMMLIWTGSIKSGVQREDLHEFIFIPDDNLPKQNKELINGRYIFRAFKMKPPTWWIYKAKGPLMDPKEHCDQQYYKLHEARDIKLFGSEAYKKAGKC